AIDGCKVRRIAGGRRRARLFGCPLPRQRLLYSRYLPRLFTITICSTRCPRRRRVSDVEPLLVGWAAAGRQSRLPGVLSGNVARFSAELFLRIQSRDRRAHRARDDRNVSAAAIDGPADRVRAVWRDRV